MATPRRPARLARRVGAVITAQLTVAAVFGALALKHHDTIGAPAAIVGLTIAFAIAGAFEMPLELRRHKFTVTLGEAVLVVGFFAVGPIGLALAAALGETINMVLQRQVAMKLAFNVANRSAAAMVAGVAYSSYVAHPRIEHLASWSIALGAAVIFSILDVAATATVVSVAEGRPFPEVLGRSAPTGLLATLASAPIGLVAVELARRSPFALLLLVPLGFAVALNSRYAIAQRDEHLRFERLYESSARTARLSTLEETLGSIASETRALGTGHAALCCALDMHNEWVGMYADEFSHYPASGDAVQAAVRLAVQSPSQETEISDAPQLLYVAPAAERVLAVSSRDDAGRVVLLVLRDGRSNAGAQSRVETLTAFANHAALLVANALLHEERAIALARQIDLNRQKDDFIAAVSHELRTPLAVMLGSVHTLERLTDRITEAQRAQLFDMTIDQGGRLQRLIDELLLVAAAQHSNVPMELENVDLASVFESIALDTAASTDGRLVREVASPGEVVTDRSKLTRVLLNLVENAAKYAPDGPIELHAQHTGQEVRISVVDHGPGIPAEDRERVFDRFVQLDQSSTRRNGGTGLGLHLCRQLAELLDGRIALTET
ncbi:MAG TPA: HAMP domain-containing sensor histidine kinase, partial [Acidimicrobiia bacterium]|nr:HAMP domain-containing sensor histidine kinase [Acidimicrobiia bacterium]